MRTPSDSLSMASAPGRWTVRTEEVGYQSLAVRTEVAQQSGVEQRGDGGALDDVAGLPGVQGQRGGAGREFEAGAGEPARQLGRRRSCGRLRSMPSPLASTEASTASQCSGKEPHNSGE